VEEGLIGLLIFLAVLWKMFDIAYELFQSSPDPFHSALGLGFAACMVGVLVVNFFGDRWSYQQINSSLWILLGLVCRARLLDAKNNGEKEREMRLAETERVDDASLSTA
jgi:uncharacterized membrane protein YwzB